MARSSGRSQRCTAQDARNRYRHAVKFLEVAEIAAKITTMQSGSCDASEAATKGVALLPYGPRLR